MVDPTAVLLETLRLGPELTPAEVQSAWKSLDTGGLPSLVVQEGCALWLYRRLRSAGAERAPPEAFASWLSQRARDHAARNLLVDARVSELGAWAAFSASLMPEAPPDRSVTLSLSPGGGPVLRSPRGATILPRAPEWRNGRRSGLKIRRGQPRASSTLASGTERHPLLLNRLGGRSLS
jgi:hypothetical protein